MHCHQVKAFVSTWGESGSKDLVFVQIDIYLIAPETELAWTKLFYSRKVKAIHKTRFLLWGTASAAPTHRLDLYNAPDFSQTLEYL